MLDKPEPLKDLPCPRCRKEMLMPLDRKTGYHYCSACGSHYVSLNEIETLLKNKGFFLRRKE